MDEKVLEDIAEYHQILDALRVRKKLDCNVEALKNAVGLSRATADRQVGKLKEQNVITGKDRHLIINSGLVYFLGISVGSQHTRVHFIDLNFESLLVKDYPCLEEINEAGEIEPDECSEYGLCFKTISDECDVVSGAFEQVHRLISNIVAVFLQQAKYPLAGIGIAVTGPVDYAEANWRSAPERFTKILNIPFHELIGYNNFEQAKNLGIFWAFDNNAKAAMVSEYQFFLEQHQGNFSEDIALLYLGSGIGSSAVLGKTLLRGSHNLSGEVGYLPAPLSYGKRSTASSISQETIEERYQKIKSLATDKQQDDYYNILTHLCNVINCILGIDRVILVGHSIREHEYMIPMLLEKRMRYTVASTQHYCKPEKGRGDSGTAAIGAAIEAYMSMCHYDKHLPDARINLAKIISWI